MENTKQIDNKDKKTRKCPKCNGELYYEVDRPIFNHGQGSTTVIGYDGKWRCKKCSFSKFERG